MRDLVYHCLQIDHRINSYAFLEQLMIEGRGTPLVPVFSPTITNVQANGARLDVDEGIRKTPQATSEHAALISNIVNKEIGSAGVLGPSTGESERGRGSQCGGQWKDVRGEGGLVVGVGSRLANGSYTWHEEREIADAPRWLEDSTGMVQADAQTIGHCSPQRPHSLIIEDVREMLTYIKSNEDRDPWLQVLWALRRSEPERGEYLKLANEWSSSAHNYKGIEDVQRKYQEADNRTGPGIGTLWKLAEDGGWQPTSDQRKRLNSIDPEQELDHIDAEKLATAADPSEIRLLCLPADILDRKFPPRQYAINPLFPRKCVTLFVPEGGLGKSYLLLTAMLHVAAGVSFLEFDVNPGVVVYFSAEDDQDEVHRRAQAILKCMPAEVRDKAINNFRLIDAVGKGLHLVTSTASTVGISSTTNRIIEAINATPGDKALIAIDTLSRVNGGEKNSNTANRLPQ